MSGSAAYRDNYEGRGDYARQNDAMLDSECARTLDWQKQPAHPPRSVLLRICLGALLLAAALAAGGYVLMIGALD
jgi:hypothetical protein